MLQERNLDPRREALQVRARCPLHADGDATLIVTWKPSRGGHARMKCTSCPAEQAELLTALGLTPADLLDSESGRGATLPQRSIEAPANRLGPLPARLVAPPPPLAAGLPVVTVAAAVTDDGQELSEEHRELLSCSVNAAAVAAAAEAAATSVQEALDEVRARLFSAAAARKRKAKTVATTEARLAARWASEAVRHVRAGQMALDKTRAVDTSVRSQLAACGTPPVAMPGADAVQRAELAQDMAQRLAQQAWDECGLAMPAAVQQVLVRAVPDVPATPVEQDPASTGGEVLPFPPGGGDGGGGTRQPGSPVRWTEYARLPTGVLVERRYTRDGEQFFHGILSLDAKVLQVEYAEIEPAEDLDTVDAVDRPRQDDIRAEQMALSYVLGYTHPRTGELIKTRVSAERARAGDWLAELPQMNVQYDATARGRAKVWKAITNTSPDAEIVTMFCTTGWRELSEHGWTYIHAGGGITSRGQVPLPVSLPGTLGRVDLPHPLQDPAVIRHLFDQHSRGLMTRLKPYVGAVLAGTAYRAVLGWSGPPTLAYGLPGSYKSAVAALTMHHFGTRWDRGLPTVSMSIDGGSTLQAIRDELWAAKDCLFFADDAAPDKSVKEASTFLGQLVRMQAERQQRDRKNPKTTEVVPGKHSRCSFLGTSEVRASAESGQQRVNVLDMGKGELDLNVIIELDSAASRRGRATVMASLLQWMAGQDIGKLKEWRKTRAQEIALRRRNAGAPDRVAGPFAELEVGWELMGRFLSTIGAYSAGEVEQMLVEVRAAMTEAEVRAKDPDAPSSVGERCRQYIASALRSGAIHVTAIGGADPEMPAALNYGYRQIRNTEANGREVRRLEPRGDKAGVITRSLHGERLHVDPNVMLPAILNVATRAGEPLQAGRAVIQRELAAAGVLRTWNDGSGLRYACKVPDINGIQGAQNSLWDLDARAVFGDDNGPTGPSPAPPSDPDPTPPPGPTSAAPTSVADPRPRSVGTALDDEARMPKFTDDTVLKSGEVGPCRACGRPTSLYVDGERFHGACWLATPAATAGPAPVQVETFAPVEDPAPQPEAAEVIAPASHPAAPAPAGSPRTAPVTEPEPVPPAAPTAPSVPTAPAASAAPAAMGGVVRRAVTRPVVAGATDRRRAASTPSPYNYSVAVVDVDGIYLPDRTIAAPEPVSSIADLAAIGEQFKIGHVAGAGLLVVTSTLAQQIGLLPTEDALTAPLANGDSPTEDDMVERIGAFLAAQTAFLSNDGGWSADGDVLRPWTRIRRENRAFRIILEPLVWIWDRRVDTAGPFNELPDVEVDAVACWQELARRLERLAELLGVPWSTSPGATGEALFEQIQRGRSRRGGKVLDAAGPLPPADYAGQVRLEGEFSWRRRPAAEELTAAAVVHKYDKRASYLATAGGTDLGYGEPVHTDAQGSVAAVNAARSGATKTKMPFGIWSVTLPAWTQPMPPPHPEQRAHEPVRRWMTTATLVLLLDDEENGGAGYTAADLDIQESWLWPDQARFLEPWYTRCRDALLAAREENDTAVAGAIKGVYTGYIGRLASQYTARGPRPWHHQPVWEATIRALARASLWRTMQKHHLTTGRVPVGIDHDEIGYLDEVLDPTVNPPAADTGRLGALKPSGSIALDDALRRRLAQGASALDKQLAEMTTDAASSS